MRLDIRATQKTMMTRMISRLFICYFALWLALSVVGKFISNEAKEFSLKDEKARLKKQKFSFKDRSFVAAFMPYRLVAYAILFFGFIFLKNENLLNVPGFLVGLAPMPIGAFIFGIMQNNLRKDVDGK